MKKIYLLLVILFVFCTSALAQVAVTVTNPTNTTPNLAASYTSLANAITALDAVTSISGPVTLTCAAGAETAPAGGYSINFTATATAVNNVVITGTATTTITASAALTAGALNDAIFKIIGCDYVTLQHFTMQENAANTTNTPAANNNMTEWGVALLRASTTDGAQHNTIQNNIISLNINYLNSFGIYSNVRHAAATPTTLSDITNVTGSNFGNKVYGNTISNVNFGIFFNGSGTAAQMDDSNDIGGSSIATGNTISNWGNAAPLTGFVDMDTENYGIYMKQQVNDNTSYNTITSSASTSANSMGGILHEYTAGSPSGTYSSTISHNTISLSKNASFVGNLFCINTDGSTSGATLNISNNSIPSCTSSGVGATVNIYGVINTSSCSILNITNNIISGIISSSNAGYAGIYNAGAVVNTININNNQLGIAGSGAISMSAATIGQITCIYNQGAAAGATININNNSIDGISVVTTGSIYIIINDALSAAAANMNFNQLGTVTGTLISFSGAQTNSFTALYSRAGSATATSSIQNNDIRGIVHSVAASCNEYFIYNNAPVLSHTTANNTFTNLSVNTTGNVYLIYDNSNKTSGQTATFNNNSIVTGFNKTGAGNSVYCFYSSAASVNGASAAITNNNFSNITVTGATSLYPIFELDGVSAVSGPTITITGNTLNNISIGTAFAIMIQVDRSAGANISSNTISNISGSTSLTGIFFGNTNGQGTFNCLSNTISNLTSPGFIEGISSGFGSLPTINISNNNLSALSNTAGAANIIGIELGAGTNAIVNDNVLHNFSSTSTASPTIYGMIVQGGTTVNIYKNKIYDLSVSGTLTKVNPLIYGMDLFGSTATVNAYNNFICDLKTPNANDPEAIRGIYVNSAQANSTFNIYYNSVYINAASTGTDFGATGIYHRTSTTATTAALNMIDNIIVNASTASGTGVTAAYRRSDATLTNFASTSDYNLFYAGTPSASKLIFYDGTNSDQTLAAYQTRVSTRDANSISLMPTFTSATDLHLTTANCRIDGRGTPVAGITDDIDAAVRNVTTPDIGADEFTATTSSTLAGVAGSAVCEDRTVSVTGTVYTSNACDLIAKVQPSGGAAVSGKVNVCVTLDASQQYFNAEPYVQRHFDIEPTTSNQSTTSATITLYFTNAEFVLYNTTNTAWPKLPTATLGNADPNRANLKVTQFHGAATTSPSTPGNYPGVRVLITPTLANVFWNGTYWEITFNVTGFSGFYVHTNLFNTPLPIAVNYFTGTKQGSDHLLNWKVTCNSTPKVTMTLERSSDSRNFSGLNTIVADAVRCNQPFDYTDNDPLKGMNYYRLKMVDADGKISYSAIVALLNAVKGFEIMNIAPNPVTASSFKLDIAAAQATKMNIVFSDMMGRVVKRQTVSLIAGFNSIDMNIDVLAPGNYNIYGTTDDNKSRLLRFVKQ